MPGALKDDLTYFLQKFPANLLATWVVLLLWGAVVLLVTAHQRFDASTPVSAGWWILLPIILGYAVVAWKVLHTIFHNNAHRLRSYWLVMPSGLLLLTGFFALHFLFGCLAACIGPWWWFRGTLSSPAPTRHVRGAILKPVHAVEHAYKKRLPPADPGLLWGGIQLPTTVATNHFLAFGAAGSGKTLTLRLLLQSLLPQIKPGSGKRALLYDAKRDALSLLYGMGIAADDIHILNPFDDRCSAWDIAQDIQTPADAITLAHALAYQEGRSEEDEYFRQQSIRLLAGVTEFLQVKAPGFWTLRDLVLAFQSEAVLTALLASDQETRHYVAGLGSDKTTSNILSTVVAKTSAYRIIAALWDWAPRKVSLEAWVNGSSILLLGKEERAKATLAAVNRLLFVRAAQLLLDLPESPHPHTFLVMDELPAIGRLEALPELALQGRSKGISLIAGFQSFESLKELYGESNARSLCGQFWHKALLHLEEPRDAEWASTLIGDAEIMRLIRGYDLPRTFLSAATQSHDLKGLQEQYNIAPVVLPAEFLAIPPIDPATRTGLSGYYLIKTDKYQHTYPLRFLREQLLPLADPAVNFQPMPPARQRLRQWDADDWERLGIAAVMQQFR
jgi:hypothetical protein